MGLSNALLPKTSCCLAVLLIPHLLVLPARPHSHTHRGDIASVVQVTHFPRGVFRVEQLHARTRHVIEDHFVTTIAHRPNAVSVNTIQRISVRLFGLLKQRRKAFP